MTAGIDDVGIGVLFGLDMYRYDFAGLLMHAEHLEAKFGVGPHTISVPSNPSYFCSLYRNHRIYS